MGVYFVTQSPLDLRTRCSASSATGCSTPCAAFTPRDRKAEEAAAATFRQKTAFDAATAITELGVGEALVSCMDGRGQPGVVQRALIVPPASRLAPLYRGRTGDIVRESNLFGHYEQSVDRESAFELLRDGPKAARAGEAGQALPGRKSC